MSSRWARVARGVSAASMATFVAALSHTLGGGTTPSVLAIIATLVVSIAICTLLAGRALSTWRLAVSVCLSQGMFHGVFSALGMPVAAAHAHTPAGAVATLDVPELSHLHGSMWIAHAIAALVTVIVILHAESAFWGMSDTARLYFVRLFTAVVPVSPGPRPVMATEVRRFPPTELDLLLSTMRHRGPPELAAA